MTQPIDWPKLLGDLQHLGLSGRDLARAAGVGADNVRTWAKGGKPSAKAGASLERLWCHMTGKSPKFLPRNAPAADIKRCEVPNLDSDEDQDPAYVHIEQLQQIWNQSILRS